MLTESARSVVKALTEGGPATRPMLASRLGLSKPTLSETVRLLQGHELVVTKGESRGATGRSAQVYGLGPRAGHVLGLDIGHTQVRATAAGLDRTTLSEQRYTFPEPGQADLDAAVAAAVSSLREAMADVPPDAGPLRAAIISVPVTVRPDRPTELTDAHLSSLRGAVPSHVQLRFENNANCSTVAEKNHGVAAGHDAFVYLQAGVRIGMGIFANNRLLRGAAGGAGEIGHLTYPWTESESPRPTELEQYLGSDALLRRARDSWPRAAAPPPENATDLLARARNGEQPALDVVRHHAIDLGRLVASIVAMLDPGLIVMGGGVGQNPELLPQVRETVAQLSWPTTIATSTLGQQATLLGAVDLAIADGLDQLFDAEQ